MKLTYFSLSLYGISAFHTPDTHENLSPICANNRKRRGNLDLDLDSDQPNEGPATSIKDLDWPFRKFLKDKGIDANTPKPRTTETWDGCTFHNIETSGYFERRRRGWVNICACVRSL